MTVNDILQAMDTIAPFRLTMDFDNTGLLIGDPNAAVTGVVLALDCTDEVIETAKARNANLIITHHPVIFHGIKHVRADSVVYQVIRNDMHVISAHTNLDIAEGGVNDCFAAELELTQLCGLTATDDEHSLGRVGSLTAEVSAEELAQKTKQILGNAAIRYTDGGKAIKTVAVCGGAGDSELASAIACGADALITGEVAHHIFIEAAHRGMTLIEAGHFHTENVVLNSVRDRLAEQFPDVPFTVHLKGVVQCL